MPIDFRNLSGGGGGGGGGTPDSAILHKTGNLTESADGQKTFNKAPKVDQSGSTRVVRETRTPRQFGAPMNGVDPDTAGFIAAIAAMGDINYLRPAELVIDGPVLLDDTVLLQRKTGRIVGPGWGTQNSSAPIGGFIKWIGAAGIPMLQVYETWGGIIESLRFIGKSTAKPSAAINFFMGGGNSNSWCTVRNVWIGPIYGYDTDQAHQFQSGILWSGTNLNNDMMRLDTVIAHQCDTGFKITGSQMGEHEFTHLVASFCDVGLETPTILGISGFHCLGNAQYDIKITADTIVCIRNYSSEGSAAMADLTSSPARLSVLGGGFQAGATLRTDGRFINGETPYQTSVDLEDFNLQDFGGYAGLGPLIHLRGGSAKALTLRRPIGISAANIDMASASGGEQRVFIVEQPPGWVSSFGYGTIKNEFDSGDINVNRHDIANKTLAVTHNAAIVKREIYRSDSPVVTQEISREDFFSGPAKVNVGRIATLIHGTWTDAADMYFYTKWSGASVRTMMKLLAEGALFLSERTVVPPTPIAGGTIYVEGGALTYKGTAGTVTTVAPA